MHLCNQIGAKPRQGKKFILSNFPTFTKQISDKNALLFVIDILIKILNITSLSY